MFGADDGIKFIKACDYYRDNQQMLTPTYYLVNHTRKEFWCFVNDISIITTIEHVMMHTLWNRADNIQVDSECVCYGTMYADYRELFLLDMT